MSTILPETTTCVSCGTSFPFGLAFSINAARRPEHRAAILDGSLQRGECPSCGVTFRVGPELAYLDIKKNQWILVEPPDRAGEWQASEEAAARLFESSYGAAAPGAARSIGRALRPRVTFGWAALREKIVCADHGLDDATVELLKMELVRSGGGPLADDVELRLVEVSDDTLTLAWVQSPSEEVLESIEAPRSLLADIEADADAWASVRAELTAGPYVDMNRLLLAPA